MTIIESNLDYLEREVKKTSVKLSAFKSKDKQKKMIKDLNPAVEKVIEFQSKIEGNIEKKTKVLKEIKKKPIVWL